MSNLSIPEQLEAIKKIMGKKDKTPFYRFTFGKYKGKTLDWVVASDYKYLIWLYNNDVDLPVKVIDFIEKQVLKGYQ